MLSRGLARFVPLTFLPLVLACGSAVQHAAQKPLPQPAPTPVAEAAPPVVVSPPLPVEDPVLTLIADSERHFEAGQKELDLGHVTAAITNQIDLQTFPVVRHVFDAAMALPAFARAHPLSQPDTPEAPTATPDQPAAPAPEAPPAAPTPPSGG